MSYLPLDTLQDKLQELADKVNGLVDKRRPVPITFTEGHGYINQAKYEQALVDDGEAPEAPPVLPYLEVTPPVLEYEPNPAAATRLFLLSVKAELDFKLPRKPGPGDQLEYPVLP